MVFLFHFASFGHFFIFLLYFCLFVFDFHVCSFVFKRDGEVGWVRRWKWLREGESMIKIHCRKRFLI